jgi:hypothetical protein
MAIMKNKSLKYIIAAFSLVSALVLFISCEDDLDVNEQKNISEADFLNNPDNLIQLVNGVYNRLLDFEMYSFSWIGMTSITSDDADKGSIPTDTGVDKDKLDALNFETSGLSFNQVYRSRYNGIRRANEAIFYIGKSTIPANVKNRLIGECKFLRALWYFDLVRCFGGVPLVVNTIDLNDTATVNSVVFVRKSKAETYAQIEADLLSAIDNLPMKSEYNAKDLGRATKGAAQALLAKAYLYEEKWQQAYDMSGNVIGSGQYSLMPNYADVWKEIGENKQESVFEVQAIFSKGIVDYTRVQGPRGTPDYGWGFNTPSVSLANSYEVGDMRKTATIIFVPSVLWDGLPAPPTWNNPRYNYKIYQSTLEETGIGTNDGNSAKNLRILKYSDVLLIRAEAASELGISGEARDNVNLIRHRAGLSDLLTVTLQDVYKERHLEMAMEHDRWFDLVRTGQAQAAMAANGKTFIPGKHELFPIPQEQITISGNRLLQNPNY